VPSSPSLPSLELIRSRTLEHYEANAQDFWDGTRDHDVSQNYSAFLSAMPNDRPLRLLDFGCGPGRDLVALRLRGHEMVGLDGCAAFVEMARAHSGCEVLHQDFFELRLREAPFDGVFANASLFHVPSALLPTVLGQLYDALVPGGVLFCSNPRSLHGRDVEGFQGGRYGSYLTFESWSKLVSDAGFRLEQHYLRPSGRPAAQQPWLATVSRKPG
jgi:SAM-dependent methyltransferase